MKLSDRRAYLEARLQQVAEAYAKACLLYEIEPNLFNNGRVILYRRLLDTVYAALIRFYEGPEPSESEQN